MNFVNGEGGEVERKNGENCNNFLLFFLFPLVAVCQMHDEEKTKGEGGKLLNCLSDSTEHWVLGGGEGPRTGKGELYVCKSM